MDYNKLGFYKLLQTAQEKGVISQFDWSNDSIKIEALKGESFQELNNLLLGEIIERLQDDGNQEVNEAVENNIR